MPSRSTHDPRAPIDIHHEWKGGIIFYTRLTCYGTMPSARTGTCQGDSILPANVTFSERAHRFNEDVDCYFMSLALQEAERAFGLGEVPVGAVVVHHDTVLGTGFNYRETQQDPLAHAELIAIRNASQALHTWRLNAATLYVTLEPCPMCAGAIIQARVGRLVFGAWDPKAGACGSLCNLLSEPQFNHRLPVCAGVLAERSKKLLQTFFVQRRQERTVAPHRA